MNVGIPSCEFHVNLFVLMATLFLWISLPFPRKRRRLEAGPSHYLRATNLSKIRYFYFNHHQILLSLCCKTCMLEQHEV